MNLYRLIDEATKTVVGFEQHAMNLSTGTIEIYHSDHLTEHGTNIFHMPNGKRKHYIPHTRKDMYTGVDVDGVKVFERDNTEHLDSLNRGTVKGIVRLTDGCFEAYIKEWGYGVMVCNLVCNIETSKFKIIGIEGVT